MGFDDHDYIVLKYLSNTTKPVGLSALAAACDIDQPTILNIIEPFLVQSGMINRTKSGREITENGFKWISRSI